MFANDFLRDQKAEAYAMPWLGTEEPLKEMLPHLIGHSGAVVSNFKENYFVSVGSLLYLGSNCNLPLLRGIGIVDAGINSV